MPCGDSDSAAARADADADWDQAMRAVSLDFDETEQEQQIAAARPHRPAGRAAAAAALWHAMPVLVRVMFTLDLLMGLLYIVSRRVRNSIGKPLLNFFDLNTETNLPSWYSAAQLALIGGLLVVFAGVQLRRGARAAWAVMLAGVAFCFLSLDETTSLHENFGYWLDHLRHRRDTVFAETGFWMLICGPAFLGALVLVGLAARRYLRGRRGVVTKLAFGAALFVAAGAGVEALSNFATPHGTAARLLILAEEMGEMLGATTMLWGVCELMRSHGLRLLVKDHDDNDDSNTITARSSV
jgi:hypothetical protein